MGNRANASGMCRNIKTLHNFAPPATDDEIRASALQFVRKLSGFTHPSRANEAAFDRAVDDVTHAARHLLASLTTNAPPRDHAAGRLQDVGLAVGHAAETTEKPAARALDTNEEATRGRH